MLDAVRYVVFGGGSGAAAAVCVVWCGLVGFLLSCLPCHRSRHTYTDRRTARPTDNHKPDQPGSLAHPLNCQRAAVAVAAPAAAPPTFTLAFSLPVSRVSGRLAACPYPYQDPQDPRPKTSQLTTTLPPTSHPAQHSTAQHSTDTRQT
ncbi:hypothetical protein PG995_002271 [Apiospora arundinis]